MSGVSKKIFESELLKIKNKLEKPIKNILTILPEEYDLLMIENYFKELYIFEYNSLYDFKEYFDKKNKDLLRCGKKSRYKVPKILDFLKEYSEVKKALKNNFKIKHKENYCEEERNLKYISLKNEVDKKNRKRKEKLEQAKARVQNIEPEFLDKLIGLYEKKNASQESRMYIMMELEKYYCKKTINFFRKRNDTEYNNQLRNKAFYKLQEWGHYVRLRRGKYIVIKSKNKKRRKFIKTIYKNQKSSIQETPFELQKRIDESLEQKLKSYDFFISHSSKNASIVKKLKGYFNQKNKNIYCDWISDDHYLKRSLVSEATKIIIEKRLRQSKELILIDTIESRNSNWVKYELNYFFNIKKNIYVWNNEKKLKEIIKELWFLDKNYKNLKLY